MDPNTASNPMFKKTSGFSFALWFQAELNTKKIITMLWNTVYSVRQNIQSISKHSKKF